MLAKFIPLVTLALTSAIRAQDDDRDTSILSTAQYKALEDYEDQWQCLEHSDTPWKQVATQCLDICTAERADGQEADGEEGRWIESSQSCVFEDPTWFSTLTGQPSDDTSIKRVRSGHCECNLAIIEELGDFFVEGVKTAGDVLKEVLCPLLKALDVVIMVGELAIPPPGKALLGATKTAIATAKAYKYAYEGYDQASEWADFLLGGFSTSEMAGCGTLIPKANALKKIFPTLANARPDVPMDLSSIPGGKGGRGGRGGGNNNGDSNNESDNGNNNNQDNSQENSQPTNQPESQGNSQPTSQPESQAAKSTAASSSAPSSSTATPQCTYYKPKANNQQRPLQVRAYNEFLKGDVAMAPTRMEQMVTRETEVVVA